MFIHSSINSWKNNWHWSYILRKLQMIKVKLITRFVETIIFFSRLRNELEVGNFIRMINNIPSSHIV